MENYLTLSEEIIDKLSVNFKELKFHFYVQDIGVKISTFLIQGLSVHFKEDKVWQKISEEIALSYQSKIKSVEDKWNIYVVYVFTDKANKSLKSKIENDKFSNRKIVVDNLSVEISAEIADKIISEQITNSDLISLVGETTVRDEINYKPKDLEIWDIIPRDKLISGEVKLQEALIEQLKACQDEN